MTAKAQMSRNEGLSGPQDRERCAPPSRRIAGMAVSGRIRPRVLRDALTSPLTSSSGSPRPQLPAAAVDVLPGRLPELGEHARRCSERAIAAARSTMGA